MRTLLSTSSRWQASMTFSASQVSPRRAPKRSRNSRACAPLEHTPDDARISTYLHTRPVPSVAVSLPTLRHVLHKWLPRGAGAMLPPLSLPSSMQRRDHVFDGRVLLVEDDPVRRWMMPSSAPTAPRQLEKLSARARRCVCACFFLCLLASVNYALLILCPILSRSHLLARADHQRRQQAAARAAGHHRRCRRQRRGGHGDCRAPRPHLARV